MPRTTKKKSILAEAKSWATRRGLFGTQAFLKYVILRFTENLNQVSDEIVFKGGNLLWVYIDTPRATVDLDLATLETDSHKRIRVIVEKACQLDPEIQYSLHTFKEVVQEGKLGAAITIAYRTDQGASNRFEVDIVYALQTDSHQIGSPLRPDRRILSATLENIIADKISASHRFGSGNSRMKDFDDLWRMSQSVSELSPSKIRKLLAIRGAEPQLNPGWIDLEMERLWATHRRRYPDLPERLETVFAEVNRWLKEVVSR